MCSTGQTRGIHRCRPEAAARATSTACAPCPHGYANDEVCSCHAPDTAASIFFSIKHIFRTSRGHTAHDIHARDTSRGYTAMTRQRRAPGRGPSIIDILICDTGGSTWAMAIRARCTGAEPRPLPGRDRDTGRDAWRMEGRTCARRRRHAGDECRITRQCGRVPGAGLTIACMLAPGHARSPRHVRHRGRTCGPGSQPWLVSCARAPVHG